MMKSHQLLLVLLSLISGQVWSFPSDIEDKSPIKQLLHNCQGPDNRLGNCVDIRDCDELLQKLVAEENNTKFKDFLRISNEVCKSHGFTAGQKVCCPLGKVTVSDLPTVRSPILQIPPLLHGPPTQHPQPHFPPEPQPQQPPRVLPLDVRSFPNCGVAKQTVFRKLIAGEPALEGSWPWIVAIGYYNNGVPKFNCAGSLISDKHILTAAQCVTPDMSFVRLGSLNINSTSDGVNIGIEKGLVHGDYNPQTLKNDIAVIVLNQKVAFSDTIRPICLPISKELQEKNFENYQPITAGWKTNPRHENTREAIQRQLQSSIISSKFCADEFRDLFTIDKNFICTNIHNDQFLAGIGGSLMFPEQRGTEFVFHTLGVLSYGEESNGGKITPDLYTRVASYTSWIQSQMESS